MSAEDVSARSVALGVLLRVLNGAYLAPTLSALLDASSLAGHDRSLATDLAYGAARRLMQLDHALAPLLKAPDKLPPRVLAALRLGAYEILFRGTPRYAAVNAWVAQVKRHTPKLAGLVNAVLRRVQPTGIAAETAAEPAHVAANLPDWLLAQFTAALGEGAAKQAAEGMLQPEPLWLTLFGQDAVALLEQDGAQVQALMPGAAFPASYRVRAPLPVAQLAAYEQGLVQPQNPSSLQVAFALGAQPGQRVHDLAAGRGVKTAVFAALGADVTAYELSGARVRAAEANLDRLGLQATHHVADLTSPPDVAPAPFVILDAPCSGTGTLRGHPEIKLRLTQDDVTELAKLQLRLLRSAATMVSPGGLLLYAVCALTHEEGPAVVQALLQERADLVAEPPALTLPIEPPALTLPTKAPALTLPTVPPATGQVGQYILPTQGLDGFYLARLRRAP